MLSMWVKTKLGVAMRIVNLQQGKIIRMYHKPNLLQHQRTRFLEAVFNTNSPSVTLNTLTSYRVRQEDME